MTKSPGISDRMLVRLAWLAPVALVMLNLWRESLSVPYLPERVGADILSPAALQSAANAWLAADRKNPGAAHLIAVVDPACPCTAPGLAALRAQLLETGSAETTLSVVTPSALASDPTGYGRILLREIPATPTLLVLSAGKMRYAGPITDGGACGSAVRKVLGLAALKNANGSSVRNIAARGCYCRTRNEPAKNQEVASKLAPTLAVQGIPLAGPVIPWTSTATQVAVAATKPQPRPYTGSTGSSAPQLSTTPQPRVS